MKQAVPEEIALIPEICRHFEVAVPERIEPIAIGLANHNYLVHADDRKNVIRFLAQHSPSVVENDLAIARQLNEIDLAAPEYLKAQDGSAIFSQSAHAVVVYPYLDGEVPRNSSPELVAELGRVLALFHMTVKQLPKPRKNWLSLAVSTDDDTWKELRDTPLPSGILHGDFHSYNVLVDSSAKQTITALLDFEEAGEGQLLLDVGRTILADCVSDDVMQLDQKLIAIFLTGYQTVRRLTPAEEKFLPAAIVHAGHCCIQWFADHGYPKYIPEHLARIESV